MAWVGRLADCRCDVPGKRSLGDPAQPPLLPPVLPPVLPMAEAVRRAGALSPAGQAYLRGLEGIQPQGSGLQPLEAVDGAHLSPALVALLARQRLASEARLPAPRRGSALERARTGLLSAPREQLRADLIAYARAFHRSPMLTVRRAGYRAARLALAVIVWLAVDTALQVPGEAGHALALAILYVVIALALARNLHLVPDYAARSGVIGERAWRRAMRALPRLHPVTLAPPSGQADDHVEVAPPRGTDTLRGSLDCGHALARRRSRDGG